MESSTQSNMIQLLNAALQNEACRLEEPNYVHIFSLAHKHSVSNMLYYGATYLPPEQKLPGGSSRLWKGTALAAASREIFQQRELKEILSSFRKAGIPTLIMKGAVIKHLYPKPEMRFMSDTDILIRPEDAKRAQQVLLELGFSCIRFDNGTTDIYRSALSMNYEIHKDLTDESFNQATYRFLQGLIEEISTAESKNTLPTEKHYAYILCHFIKHLLDGGVGIRQVMDIYLCRMKWEFDEEKLAKLLAELELTEFAATIEKLANHWFGGGEGDAVTEELGEYILGSGVFGKEEQKVADRMLKEEKKQGKFSYVWSRLFPSYKTMCFYYPVLKRWAVLLPAFWVWRMIYALIFRRDKLKREVSTVSETDRDAVAQRALFYRRCGLNVYPEYDSKA